MTFVAIWVTGSDTKIVKYGHSEQTENRQKTMILFASLVAGFVFARTLAYFIHRERPMLNTPMEAPMDPQVWESIKSFIAMQGAFPSDHAVLFAVMTVGVFVVNKRLGWIALALDFFFSVMRVGLGFHWPTDMLIGNLIGVAVSLLFFFTLRPYFQWLLNYKRRIFEKFAVVAYPVAFLILIDFTNKFEKLFGFLAKLKSIMLPFS